MQIISKKQRIEETHYALRFDILDGGVRYYSFPCDEFGEVYPSNPSAAESLRLCLTGDVRGVNVSEGYLDSWEHTFTLAAIGRCDRCEDSGL